MYCIAHILQKKSAANGVQDMCLSMTERDVYGRGEHLWKCCTLLEGLNFIGVNEVEFGGWGVGCPIEVRFEAPLRYYGHSNESTNQ